MIEISVVSSVATLTAALEMRAGHLCCWSMLMKKYTLQKPPAENLKQARYPRQRDHDAIEKQERVPGEGDSHAEDAEDDRVGAQGNRKQR